MEWNIQTALGVISSILGVATSVIGILKSILGKGGEPKRPRYDEDEDYDEGSRRSRRRRPHGGVPWGSIALIIVGLLALGFGGFMCLGVGGAFYLHRVEASKKEIAEQQIHTIETAVNAYRVNHTGVFPNSLQELIQPDENGRKLLKEADITDPWGKPYAYDFMWVNREDRPRIWTVAPDGEVIANWKKD